MAGYLTRETHHSDLCTSSDLCVIAVSIQHVFLMSSSLPSCSVSAFVELSALTMFHSMFSTLSKLLPQYGARGANNLGRLDKGYILNPFFSLECEKYLKGNANGSLV